jgi:hypothetical protein
VASYGFVIAVGELNPPKLGLNIALYDRIAQDISSRDA